jgi:hypothetical protein
LLQQFPSVLLQTRLMTVKPIAERLLRKK